MGDRKKQRQLLGYLLGALDDRERQRIDEQLATDPGLAAEVARVEESLEPLRTVARVHRPPPGLAARACSMVFAYSAALTGRKEDPGASRRPVRERARAMSPAAVPPASTATWGWSDLLVAAGVFLAIAGLIFPAIQSSRMNMRLVACQNNLRQIGAAQAQFQQTRPVALENVATAVPRMTAAVPYALLLQEKALVDPTSVPATRLPKPVYRGLPISWIGLGRGGVSPHQGFTQTVHGQNLLFLDGRATFLAMGPIVDPTIDESPSDDPFANSWPSDGVGPVVGPSDLAPIVLISRPGP